MKEPTHYHCIQCGETFEIPEAVIETWREQSEHFGQVAFETKEVPHCPFCDGDDLDDAYEEDEDAAPLAVPCAGSALTPVSATTPGGEALNHVLVEIARAGAMREWQ